MTDGFRRLWLAAAAAVAVASAIAIVTVLRGEPGQTDARTIVTLVAVFLCGAAATASLELVERTSLRVLGAVGLLAAAGELALFLLGTWRGEFAGERSSKLILTAFAWVVATIVAATLPLVASARGTRAAYAGVVGTFAVGWAAVSTGLVWSETTSDGWLKALGVLAILMVGGYLAGPMLRRCAPREAVST